MSSSSNPNRSLGHHLYAADVAADGSPAVGPWPGMSRRAKLIARALVASGLTVGFAAIDPSLLVMLAFALPFWVAVEFEAPSLSPVAVAGRASVSPLRLIAPCLSRGSDRDSAPRAA